ncbi:TonB-linked SusC/RagA family outer membrane protein [Dyadobacter sp. BE31]|nr:MULTISPECIES: TonB-dependent receptor [unclassified Dyadobacter]MDR7214968.1 TonB-linked SusC/RagA family outer membrane protein [Dyadobacter sp. BE31]
MKQGRHLLFQCMKISLVQALLAFVFMGVSWANDLSAQELLSRRVSLNLTEVKLRPALKELERVADVRFSYTPQIGQSQHLVTLKVTNAPLGYLLDKLFQPMNIRYELSGKHIILSRTPAPAAPVKVEVNESQMINLAPVRGKVVDEIGVPLAGVSILLKGTTNGTLTNGDGEFSFDVPGGDGTLVFSFVGFVSKEVPIGGRTFLDIKLEPLASALNEVVVVGYGAQKKITMTGAVSTVSADAIKNVPTANITNALAGRVAGLFATQKSGAPGSGSSLIIRGKSTFNSTDPIYVIDGIVRTAGDFEALSTTEIDNISVLKDATSAAVYGARSANGVILVTTKRGTADAPTFTYSAYVGKETPSKVPERMNAYENALYRNNVAMFNNLPLTDPSYYTQDEIDYFRDNNINYDWFKAAWKNPVFTQHNLSVSGGSEKVKYFSSLGYNFQNGGLKNLKYDRFNLRSNVDAKIAKGLNMALMIDASLQKRDRPYWPYDGGDDDRMYDLYRGLLNKPSFMPWKIGDKYVRAFQVWNPIGLIDNAGFRSIKRNTFNGILKLDYAIPRVHGLKANVSFNFRKYYDYDKTVRKKYPVSEFKTTGGHNHLLTEEVTNSLMLGDWENSAFASFNEANSYQLNAGLQYEKTFNEKHFLTIMGMYEQSEGTGNYLYGMRNKLLTPTIEQLFIGNAASENQSATGSASETGRLGYIGRVTYSYNEKYLFEANFRSDASLKFAPEGRWGFFPSVSAGWRLSEESFVKNNFKNIDNLKLRASYGLLGNDGGANVAEYGYQSIFSVASGAVFGSATSGIAPGALPNYNITWEKTRITDIGLEGSLWRGLLSFELDYFKKYTYDILGARVISIPNTFGATLPKENYGIVSNQGIEIVARHDHTLKNGLQYFLGGNFSFARNKVKQQDYAAGAFDYQIPTGRSMGYLSGYEAVGIARTQADLENLPKWGTYEWSLGDVILKDKNGDGTVDSKDMVVLSNQGLTPQITYGITTGGRWKGFDLNVLLQGVANRKLMFPNRSDLWENAAILKMWNDSWSPENPNAKYPRVGGIGASSYGASRAASSFWVMNGNYVRLKNIEIGYSLPKVLTNKLGIGSLRIYVSGANLLTLDKINVSDPEAIEGPFGVYQYPIMKSYNAGLSLRF